MPRQATVNRGGRPPTIDWAKWDRLLGQLADTELARLVGCSDVGVLRRRRKLGVPPFRPRNGFDERGRRTR